MEKPKPSELFSPEQLAAIKNMIAEELAKPRPKEFKMFSGSSHPNLAQKIADVLDSPLGKTKPEIFSCGEQYVALIETVRDKIVFMIQTCREKDVALDYEQLYFMSDAAMNADSGKRVAVIPHFGYARQDKVHGKREPISARVIAKNLETNGVNHVITCQLHSDQIQGFFKIPVDHVKPHELFADYFRKKELKDLVVVSTDAGGVKNCEEFKSHLGAGLAILHKQRPEHNKSEVTHIEGDVKDKTCIIYDDMVDTAGSVCNAKDALMSNGANPDVYLCATHPIFSGHAIKRLKAAKFKEVVVSDTLPLDPEKQFEGLTQISVAHLIAEKMAKIIGMPLPSEKK